MPTTGAALDPRVRGQLRSVAIIVAVALALAVVSGWFLAAGGAVSLMIPFGIVLLPASTLISIGLIVIYLLEGRRIARDPDVPARQRAAALLSPVGAAVILMLVVPSACSTGAWGRRQVVLSTLEPAFRQMMAAASDGRPIRMSRHDGQPLTMVTQHGDVPRYYFELAGLGDNGTGFVYDPTDAVLAAHGWGPNRTFTAPPDVREWFGGDIVWCKRVRDHYHYCGLT